jgi:hypothetical protein
MLSMKRFKVPALLAITFASASFWFIANSRASTETPDYKVIRTDEKFEIRDYSALTVATTRMEKDGMNASFGELLGFISGENENSEKIAMTAPVLIDTSEETKTMGFIMPRETVQTGVPKPEGDEVKVVQVDAARFAVLRFEGERTVEVEKEANRRLTAWLEAQKIAPKGTPLFAYYDPPWTPVSLRRNEVMIQIDKTAK